MTEPVARPDPEFRAAQIRAAVAEARPLVRGQSDSAARATLTDVLRRHDVFIPPGQLAAIAWLLAHPWQTRLRPFRSWRDVRRLSNQPDRDGKRFQKEADTLSSLMWGIPEVRETSSRRSFDGGVHEVRVDPWSPELAAQLQQIAEPIRIIVVPARR